MAIGTYTPPPLQIITQNFFSFFFYFRCILLQISHKKCFFISISILGRSGVKICIFIKRTCISIFSKIELVDQSKPCTQIYLHNIASSINLQLPIVILKKKTILLDIHHHKTYMYINF